LLSRGEIHPGSRREGSWFALNKIGVRAWKGFDIKVYADEIRGRICLASESGVEACAGRGVFLDCPLGAIQRFFYVSSSDMWVDVGVNV